MYPDRLRAFLQGAQEQVGRPLVIAGHLPGGGQPDIIIEVHRVQRAEPNGLFKGRAGLFGTVCVDVQPAESAQRPGRIRVDRNGPQQHDAGDAEIARKRMHGTQHRQDERFVRRVAGCLVCQAQGLYACRGRVLLPVVDGSLCPAPGRERQRQRVIRIEFQCAAQQSERMFGPLLFKVPDVTHGLHREVVGTEFLRRLEQRADDFRLPDGGL